MSELDEPSYDPEMAIAKAIDKIVDPPSQILRERYSRIGAGYPVGAGEIIEFEALHMSLAGIPKGWTRPLFDQTPRIRLMIERYVNLSPSIGGKEAQGVKDMIAAYAMKGSPIYAPAVMGSTSTATTEPKRSALHPFRKAKT